MPSVFSDAFPEVFPEAFNVTGATGIDGENTISNTYLVTAENLLTIPLGSTSGYIKLGGAVVITNLSESHTSDKEKNVSIDIFNNKINNRFKSFRRA